MRRLMIIIVCIVLTACVSELQAPIGQADTPVSATIETNTAEPEISTEEPAALPTSETPPPNELVPSENVFSGLLPPDAKSLLGIGTISTISYSLDGTRLAVGTSIGLILFDAAMQPIWSASVTQPHDYDDWPIVWSPDGSKIATREYFRISIWDAATGTLIASRDAEEVTENGPVNYWHDVAWSPDGTRVTIDGYAGEIWNFTTGEVVQLERDYPDEILSRFVWLPGEPEQIAGVNYTINPGTAIWDAQTGSKLQEFTGGWDSWSPDFSYVLTYAMWHLVIDVRTGEEVWNVQQLAEVSPDWSKLLVTNDGRPREVYAFGQFDAPLHILTGSDGDAWTYVSWSPDSQIVTTDMGDTYLQLWDAETGTPICATHELTPDLTSEFVTITWSPDSRLFTTLYPGDSYTYLWDAAVCTQLAAIPVIDEDWTVDVQFLNGSERMMIKTPDMLREHDVKSGAMTTYLASREYQSIQWEEDSIHLITISGQEAFRWDTNTGELIETLPVSSISIVDGGSEAVSPDGQWIASQIGGAIVIQPAP